MVRILWPSYSALALRANPFSRLTSTARQGCAQWFLLTLQAILLAADHRFADLAPAAHPVHRVRVAPQSNAVLHLHGVAGYALFTHHLFAVGAPLGSVGREVGLNGRARVDVVLFDPAARGDFARTDLARVAIEFKGGAYNVRDALRDTVRPGRPIQDL